MNAADSLQILERYSLVILPVLVVAEQFGIPLPAVPALLGVGALAATERISLPLVLGTIAVVAACVDLAWYELGRRRGAVVPGNSYSTAPDLTKPRAPGWRFSSSGGGSRMSTLLRAGWTRGSR
jgi:membrane protein DedA with SNARE-associated domain